MEYDNALQLTGCWQDPAPTIELTPMDAILDSILAAAMSDGESSPYTDYEDEIDDCEDSDLGAWTCFLCQIPLCSFIGIRGSISEPDVIPRILCS